MGKITGKSFVGYIVPKLEYFGWREGKNIKDIYQGTLRVPEIYKKNEDGELLKVRITIEELPHHLTTAKGDK
jgi:hypothetical protein